MTSMKKGHAELRAQITQALIKDIGVSERMAQPFVESIMACFAGQRPYFPAKERNYQVGAIKAALEEGASVKTILREFDLSRRMLHDLFPGGLPKPSPSRQDVPR